MHIVVVHINIFILFFYFFFHSIHRSLPRSVDCVNDFADNGRIRQRRGITKAVLLAAEDLAQNTAHDLTTTGLGKVVDNEDGLGGGEGSNGLTNLHDKVLADLLVGLVAFLQRDEGVNGLAGEFIGDTDDGGFGNLRVLDQSGFDFSGGQTVSRNVDNIVNTATDPVVAVLITASTVTSELQ